MTIRNFINRMMTWVFKRIGLKEFMDTQLDKPVLKHTHNPAYCLGGLTLVTFIIQLITGLFLAFFYTASVDHAWDSVMYITYDVQFGFLIRNIHRWASNLMVILMILHMFRVYFMGAYKAPRELNWIVGVALMVLTLFLGFSGYLLPWDNRAYYASSIGTNFMLSATEELVKALGGIAFIGGALVWTFGWTVPLMEWVREAMLGGPDIGPATLSHFYILHVFALPMILLMIIVVHVYLVRKHGIAGPM